MSGIVKKPPESITVKAIAFSELAQKASLAWEVPMSELLKNAEGGRRTWKRLQYVLRLADPRSFSAPQIVLTQEERALLEQFVRQARTIAETTLLGAEESVTINIMDLTDEESIETIFSETDVTVGFMILLRQCYADGEEASFSKVSSILGRRINEHGDTTAQEVLKFWHRAHKRLGNKTLEELIQLQLIASGEMPAHFAREDGQFESTVLPSPAPPKELFAKLWYGGQVHWGKHRDDMAESKADPFAYAMWEIATRQSAVELAHFYLGYALLVETALTAAVPES